jgi:predicted nucleic acid-binding protein
MAFLRLLTNPSITGKDVLSRRRAWEVFDALIADPRIRLLAEPQGLEPLWAAFSRKDDKSHLLWTDDYLAAFAQASDADLVTFDRALSKRYRSVRTVCLA